MDSVCHQFSENIWFDGLAVVGSGQNSFKTTFFCSFFFQRSKPNKLDAFIEGVKDPNKQKKDRLNLRQYTKLAQLCSNLKGIVHNFFIFCQNSYFE